MLEEEFAGLAADQAVARPDAAQIANARINEMEELWHHPQLSARGRWREVMTPAGPVAALLPPATLSTSEARMEAVPALGEHTDSVLSWLGFSPEEITQFRAEAVV